MAEEALGLSLDDLIKKSSKKQNTDLRDGGDSRRGTNRRTRGSSRPEGKPLVVAIQNRKIGKRPMRGSGLFSRVANRPLQEQYEDPQAKLEALEGNASWSHDKYDYSDNAPVRRLRQPQQEVGTRLEISNLDYGVSDDDIKELFESTGELVRHGVVYDHSGRSEGRAEVVFVKREAALAAKAKFDGVALDGQAMKIVIASAQSQGVPGRMAGRLGPIKEDQPTRGRGFQGGNSGSRMFSQALGRSTAAPRSSRGARGGGGGGGGGRGRMRSQVNTRSAADLDAELETYMQE